MSYLEKYKSEKDNFKYVRKVNALAPTKLFRLIFYS